MIQIELLEIETELFLQIKTERTTQKGFEAHH